VVPAGILRFLEFAILELAQGDTFDGSTGGRECVLDIFSGVASVAVNGGGGQQTFHNAGGREDVFSGPPAVMSLPPQCSFQIQAASPFRAGLFSAPATRRFEPALIRSNSVASKEVGQGTFRRTVYTTIGDSFAASACWRAKR